MIDDLDQELARRTLARIKKYVNRTLKGEEITVRLNPDTLHAIANYALCDLINKHGVGSKPSFELPDETSEAVCGFMNFLDRHFEPTVVISYVYHLSRVLKYSFGALTNHPSFHGFAKKHRNMLLLSVSVREEE